MDKEQLSFMLSDLRAIGLSRNPFIDNKGYIIIVDVDINSCITVQLFKNANTYLENDCKYCNTATNYEELRNILQDIGLY